MYPHIHFTSSWKSIVEKVYLVWDTTQAQGQNHSHAGDVIEQVQEYCIECNQ